MWRRERTRCARRDPLPGGGGVRRGVGRGYREIGIAGEHLQKVFDPYFIDQAGRSGLGLATSYAILRKHDGIITVRRKLGAGAVFRVYLPASPGKVAEKRPERRAVRWERGRSSSWTTRIHSRGGDGQCSGPRVHGGGSKGRRGSAESLRGCDEKRGDPFDAVIMDLTVPRWNGGQEATRKAASDRPEGQGDRLKRLFQHGCHVGVPLTCRILAVGPETVQPEADREVVHRLFRASG